MDKLKIDLNYCYGIKKLQYDFDLRRHKNYLIYAPNGTMKTSFAKTFLALSKGKKPIDEVSKRATTCVVVDENDVEIPKEDIFVVSSYEDEYFSPNSAKLMVQKDLKKSYDEILTNINVYQNDLENNIKGYFFCDDLDVRKEICSLYDKENSSFLDVIENHSDDLLNQDKLSLDFKNIPYLELFNENIEKFCKEPKNIDKIEAYEKCYDDLISSSPIFKRGVFSQYNADDLINNLNENKFFEAKHELVLHGISEKISNIDELKKIIDEEKNKIFSDPKLKTKFDRIDAELNKRALVKFRKIIEVYPQIIPLLKNYDEFRKRVLSNALMAQKDQVLSLTLEYKKSKDLIDKIKEQAKTTKSQWDKVIDIFKSRFTVPFEIEVPNMQDVIFNDSLPEFKFEYVDLETHEGTPIARKNLEKILSQGEKRALYLLNIINDLEAIKLLNKPMIIVTDDISESFDYKNKYAIIEYLQELASSPNLHFIILTHNFDFFRTCSLRMSEIIMPQMVSREDRGLSLEKPKYVFRTPFSEIKSGITRSEDKDIITAIPFIRNILEITNGISDENYLKLTSLLHLKESTKNITVKDLKNIFEASVKFDNELNFDQGREDKKVYDLIIETAKEIYKRGTSTIDLDGKIVLSMAIRLLAESFMIQEIKNKDTTGKILEEIYSGNNQTGKLLKQFKSLCEDQYENILLMNRVTLLSSENIHINSFMFEPLIDISIKSLIDLFGRVNLLN